MLVSLSDFKIQHGQPCDEAWQSAFDQIAQHGGGILDVPTGKYIIEGTIRVPPTVEIRAPSCGRAFAAEILHKPKQPNTDLFVCQDDVSLRYNYMGQITGLCLTGDPKKSRRGIDFLKPSGLILNNCILRDFQVPMRLQSGIHCKFEMCRFIPSDLPGHGCIGVELGPRKEFTATTYHFTQCYWSLGDWCFKMYHSSTFSTRFSSCIFESSYQGVADIHTGNYAIVFDNTYVENCGRLGNGEPAFKLGRNGPPGFDGGVTAFFQHGLIMSAEKGKETRVLFDCDYARRLVARDMIVYPTCFNGGLTKTTKNTGEVSMENIEK